MDGQTTTQDGKRILITYGIGDVVTGAYPGRGNVFGVIADFTGDDDSDCMGLWILWEDGIATAEACGEIVTMPEYLHLTGRHYDPQYTLDKVEAAHPTWDRHQWRSKWQRRSMGGD